MKMGLKTFMKTLAASPSQDSFKVARKPASQATGSRMSTSQLPPLKQKNKDEETEILSLIRKNLLFDRQKGQPDMKNRFDHIQIKKKSKKDQMRTS